VDGLDLSNYVLQAK